MANRNFARAVRRKTQWAGMGSQAGTAAIPDMITIAAGATALLSIGFVIRGALGIIDEETTVTRTIGMLRARIDLGTADLQAKYAMGCAVVTQEALAAGVASLPDPATAGDFEWLYYSTGQLQRGLTANDENGLATVAVPFDVRGQRIVRAGQNIAWWCSAVDAAVQIGVAGRYLVKLT